MLSIQDTELHRSCYIYSSSHLTNREQTQDWTHVTIPTNIMVDVPHLNPSPHIVQQCLACPHQSIVRIMNHLPDVIVFIIENYCTCVTFIIGQVGFFVK